MKWSVVLVLLGDGYMPNGVEGVEVEDSALSLRMHFEEASLLAGCARLSP